MDVRDDTTSSNGGLDQSVQFFVTTDGQLQMTGSDTLHFEILGGVTSQLEHLCKHRIELIRKSGRGLGLVGGENDGGKKINLF